MGLSPRAMLEQAALFRGWVYGTPSYPVPLPGVKVPLAGRHYTNCCAFVEAVVVGGAHFAGLDLGWGLAQHNRFMIVAPRDRMGPVEALIDAGVAHPWDATKPPPPWSVCQGWNGSRGHTFLIADSAGDDVLILEANKAYGLNGPGWRSMGPIEGAAIPSGWQQHKRCWTWSRVRAEYPEIAVCALRVVADAELPAADAVLPDREPEGGGSVRA